MRITRILVLSGLFALCVGCSAFRWGERSYQEVEERNLFGSYSRALGWKRGKPGGSQFDPTHRIRVAQV